MPNGVTSERAVPHNLEAERALLGSVLLDNAALDLILPTTTADDFFSQAHRITFRKMLELHAEQRQIDLVTLSEELSKQGLIEQAGGAAYLAALTDGVPIGASDAVSEYARIIKEKSALRSLINTSHNLISRCLEGVDDPTTLIQSAREQLLNISAMTPGGAQKLDAVEAMVEFGAKLSKPYAEQVYIDVGASAEEQTPKPAKPPAQLYPHIPEHAWHTAAALYRDAHAHSSEASDNWHFAAFYTAVAALAGRSVYTRMGRKIYPNLYTILVGQVGGDGKDTALDYAFDFLEMIDQDIYLPETIDSREGFLLGFARFQDERLKRGITSTPRAIVRLIELRALLDKTEQKGAKGIIPMLNAAYDNRPKLSKETVTNPAEIRGAYLCFEAGTALRWMRNMNEADLASGFGRRLIFVPGDAKAPQDDPDPPNMEILIPLARNLNEIAAWWRAQNCPCLPLTASAKKRWAAWYPHYKSRISDDDLVGIMTIGDRVTCRKIALINAYLDRALQIEEDNLERAIAFTEFLYESRWPVFLEHGSTPMAEIDQKIIARVRKSSIQRLPWRAIRRGLQKIDNETFQRRMKSLTTGPDPPLRLQPIGRKTWVCLNE